MKEYKAPDFKGLAAFSSAYRAAMSEAMLSAPRSVLVADRGHGTVLAALEAARMSGARDLLLVAPVHAMEMAKDQLKRAGMPIAGSAGRKRADTAGLCRLALNAHAANDGEWPRVWLAQPNHMTEIGNWHDAWKDTWKEPPFGMLFALDGREFVNARSERGQGIRETARHTAHAVLFLDARETALADVSALAGNFGTIVRPALAEQAANACEAMCMGT